MSFLRAWLAALAIIGVVFVAGVAAAEDSVTIPLDPNPNRNNFTNYVTVSVGGGPASQVLLDTGSTGMRILQSDVGPDVVLTDMTETYGYSSGNFITGVLAFAPVSFPDASSPLSTTGPIAIQVVTSVTCQPDKPDCPGWPTGQAGVMGVAYDNDQIFNPLAQLPGNLGSGFIVVANDITNPNVMPELVVGLTPSNMQGFVFADLGKTGQDNVPPGTKAWNTKGIYTCFAVNSGSPGCLNSVFDTGANQGSFVTPGSPTSGQVPPGDTVTITVPDTISLSLLAGNTGDSNLFVYEQAHGSTPGFNTGSEVFRYYTVLFDDRTGKIGFSPIVNWIFGTYEPTNDAVLGAPGAAIALGGTLELKNGFNSDRPIYLLSDAAVLKAMSGTSTLSGTLSGFSPLTIEGPGTLYLTGDSLFDAPVMVKDGTLRVNGILPAPIALGDGATLGGTGMIAAFAAAKGSTVAPGNSIGTLHVVDSAAFGPGSVYQAELGAPGTSDLIAIDGQGFLGGNLEGLPSAGFEPVLGASYTVLTAEGGITAQFSPNTSLGSGFGNIAATYPFLAPALTYTPNAVNLTIGRSDVPFAAAGQTPNEFAAGAGADGLALDDPVVTALVALNQTSAANAFDSLSGEVYASTQSLMQQQSASLRDATNGRLRQAFDGGAPDAANSQLSAATLPAIGDFGPTVWTEGFGGWDHFQGTSNTAALDGTDAGFLMGIDNPIGPNWRAGIAGGYSGSSFDVQSRSSSGSASNYDLLVYGGARYGDLGIRLGGAYSWSNVSASRSVSFPGFAGQFSSNYDARTAQIYGEVGYAIHPEAGTMLEPLADLAYVNVATDGFSESGGPGALTANSTNFGSTYSVLGGRVSRDFDIGDGSALTASARLGWQHAFGDVNPSTTLAFTGTAAPFTVSGVPINQNAAILQAGIAYAPLPNLSLGLTYAGQLAPNAQENSLNGTVDFKF